MFVRETLPQRTPGDAQTAAAHRGYGPVLRDRRYLAFFVAFTITTIPSAILMTLLAVYAKERFGVPESQYGFIMATNALMVVLLQVGVTRLSGRFAYLPVMAAGALLYGVGAGSVALGQGFWAFWLSMVILTLGELLLAPTGSAFTANVAPPEMRGRYMGLYGLTWSVAFGLGPLAGGWLSDTISPRGPWIASLAAGLLGALAFILLSRRVRLRPPAAQGLAHTVAEEGI
jgi:MFS family permease